MNPKNSKRLELTKYGKMIDNLNKDSYNYSDYYLNNIYELNTNIFRFKSKLLSNNYFILNYDTTRKEIDRSCINIYGYFVPIFSAFHLNQMTYDMNKRKSKYFCDLPIFNYYTNNIAIYHDVNNLKLPFCILKRILDDSFKKMIVENTYFWLIEELKDEDQKKKFTNLLNKKIYRLESTIIRKLIQKGILE